MRGIKKYKNAVLVIVVEIGSSWNEAGRISSILAEYNMSQDIDVLLLAAKNQAMPRWAETDIAGILQSRRIPRHGSLGQMIFLSTLDSKDQWAPGVITDDASKIGGVFQLRRSMARELFVCPEDKEMISADNVEFLNKFERQLKNFRRDVKKSKDHVHGRDQVKFTGKTSMDPDDLASAVTLLMFRYETMCVDEQFREYARRNGWAL